MKFTLTDARPERSDYPRDRYGRVKLGDRVLYSPSSLPNYLGAGFSAPAWSARCQAKGAGLAPWLGLRAAPLDVNADRAELDQIVAEMETFGGRSAKADMGTAMHSAIRRLWRGMEPEVPDEMAADIASVRAAIDEWGLELVDGWDERFVINHELGTGGSCDAFVACGRLGGAIVALDVKTGQLKPLDAAMQMSCYSGATESWEPEGEPEPIPFDIRTDIGLVLHVPWGKGAAKVVALDLVEGRRLAALAIAAHTETLDSGRVVIDDPETWQPAEVAVTPNDDSPGVSAIADEVEASEDDKGVQVVMTLNGHGERTVAAIEQAANDTMPFKVRTNLDTARLSVRIGDLRARLARIVDQGAATKDEIGALMKEAGLPSLAKPDEQTTDTVDNWEGIVTALELALEPEDLEQRTATMIDRLQRLPVDLMAAAKAAAAALDPRPPNLATGRATALDLDRIDAIVRPLELQHAERIAQVTQALSELAEDEAAQVVAWCCEQRNELFADTIPIESLDNLEAERVVALAWWYANDEGRGMQAPIFPDDAIEVAQLHGLPVPDSLADLANDRVLTALVMHKQAAG